MPEQTSNIGYYIISREEWLLLAGKNIYFGHQSVGKNIIDGLVRLQGESKYLEIRETTDTTGFVGPIFAHSAVGEILYPKKKIDDFVRIIDDGMGERVDIAFMKIGYPDLNKHTDINALFEYYRKSMDSLQARYPGLRIIHCTVSLTSKPEGLKGLARVVLKKDNNVYINRFNGLMRDYYPREVIFDIAEVQSELPDGSTCSYRNDIPAMIPWYTTDGGHLNKYGQEILAKELIKVLLRNIDNPSGNTN